MAHHPTKTKSKGGPKVPPQEVHPGQESYRRAREEKTRFLLMFCVHIHIVYLLCSSDVALTTLVNLCHTVTAFPSISAWDHTFTPREYLLSHLEDLFIR